jgi:hypothetical protein
MLNLYVMGITNPIKDPLYNFTLLKMTDKEMHHILRLKHFLQCDKMLYMFYIILQALSGHSE